MTKEQAKILKPGDLVECNTPKKYGITKPGVLCSYVRPCLDNVTLRAVDIIVRVESGEFKGSEFPVCSEFFDLACKLKQPNETEVFSLLSI